MIMENKMNQYNRNIPLKLANASIFFEYLKILAFWNDENITNFP